MTKYGFDFPSSIRKTFVNDLEDNWYIPLLSEKKGIPIQSIKRSNFGQYSMAVNYLTSVLEEASAINKVAIYNIDHMAQIRFWGKDAANLLNRTLGANFVDMKIGTCKYTLLLNEKGGVQDDMILMRVSLEEFIMVINAGHDITGEGEDHGERVDLIADVDRIMMHKLDNEDVQALDVSDQFVKIDIQGPLSYKLIKDIYGESVLKNRNNPEKNMNFFCFNEFTLDSALYYLSRTGYTNRWGWELYIPVERASEDFKIIVSKALDLGGLLVGLGGRDENRISAGAFGLPLMGQEYDPYHTPVNAPLFEAAIDMTKEDFIGKKALQTQLDCNIQKKMSIVVSEGIVTGRGVYRNGKRIGSVTSSINSPNISHEKRIAIGSKRRNVNEADGTAAIGLCWLTNSPYEQSLEGNDVTEINGQPVRIPVELYKEDGAKNPQGSPVLGYLTQEGISIATASKPLKSIENL